MQITINVPTPVVRTVYTTMFLAVNAPTIVKENAKYAKYKRSEKKAAKRAAKEQVEYDAYIAEAKANIGPYVPVSYTQVWA